MRPLLWVVALLAVVSTVILRADPAGAHAALVSAEPAENAFLQRAPGEITLRFSEPLAPDNSSIRVLDAAGREVPVEGPQFSQDRLTMRVFLPALGPGIYNVLWSNVSVIDGHGLRGAYPFTVLMPDGSVPDQVNSVGGLSSDPDPAPDADGIAVRALALFGLLLATGPAMLVLLGAMTGDAVRRALSGTVVVGVVVLVIATLLNLQLIRETYSGRSLADLLLDTRAGNYWIARIGAALFIGALVGFLSERPRMASAGMLAGGVVYLWGFTATSHAAASTGSAWAQLFDIVHGAAAVAWIGAVIGVAVTARSALRNGNYRDLMPRFSLVASLSVFVLLGTGVVNAFIEIDEWNKLVDTRYGVALLVKLGLMAVLLAVAFYNARRGRRQLVSTRNPRPFLVTVTGEALLGIAVFAVAAVLTQSTVAKGIVNAPDARPFEDSTAVEGYDISLNIDPNRTGVNTYRVTALHDGSPASDVESVRLTFRYLDDETVGPARLNLTPSPGEDAFSGQGPFLTLEGNWRVEIELRRTDADDLRAFFDVRPAGAAVNVVRRGGAWDNPAPGLDWNQFGGLVFFIAGLGFALFKSYLWRFGKPAGWAGNASTAFCFGLGALLLFGIHSHDDVGANLRNPIFPDQNSISIGRRIYQQNCASCHGPNGVPPEGLDLNPYPLDLTVHVPQHPDGELFMFISEGIPGTAMPAWSDEGLSDEEIWHVVNYLRTLGAVEQ